MVEVVNNIPPNVNQKKSDPIGCTQLLVKVVLGPMYLTNPSMRQPPHFNNSD